MKKTGKLAALKIGIAYQRDLDFDLPSKADAEKVYSKINQNKKTDYRLFQNYIFHKLIQLADAFHLPVQIHTGTLSGHWQNITQGNPASLIPIFQRYRAAPFEFAAPVSPLCAPSSWGRNRG